MTTREERMARIMARPRVAPVVERVAPALPPEPKDIAQPSLLPPEPEEIHENENASGLSMCIASPTPPESPVSDGNVHPALSDLEELRTLQASIPERRRDLVAVLVADGVGYAEIARALGVTRQTVREWAGAKSR